MNVASYAYLKDFDWSVRLALSSDKLSGLKQPLILLKFSTLLADGKSKETLIEMSKEEAKDFISKLKSAQAASNQFMK